MARIENIRVYPLKGLDGVAVEAAAVLDGGTLAGDREFALFDGDGDVLNGKRTDRVHDVRTDFDPGSTELTVAVDGERRTFDLDAERERAAAFFGDVFGVDLTLERDESLGFVDRRSIASSATTRRPSRAGACASTA